EWHQYPLGSSPTCGVTVSQLFAPGGPRPPEVDAGDELVVVPDLILADRHLDARPPEQPLDQRLEHPLGGRCIGVPEGEELPQHSCPAPSVTAEDFEVLLHPVEE